MVDSKSNMGNLDVDLLKDKYNLRDKKRPPVNKVGRVFLILLVVLAVGAGALSYQVMITGEEGSLLLFGALKRLVTSSNKVLAGEADDRINILAMGVGGAGHDGPELTDTIIFGSYRPSTDEVGMLSIPRDLTIPIDGYGWRKINHLNAYEGPETAAEEIGDLLNQEVHYWIKVDFQGFADLIDDLGGVDIYVETAFSDYQYPTADYLVQTISFEEGWQHMDGEAALMYVRSRHGNNGEGSDFARSRRQQKVLMAVKEKAISVNTLLNPGKINKILSTLSEHIETNLSTWEILRLATLARDVDPGNIKNHVLDNSAGSPLYNEILNGAYVLLPKNDDWGPVERMAANIFSADDERYEIEAPPEEPPAFVKVEIQNGTNISGYAFRTSQLLEGQGFEVTKISNAVERSFDHTLIYDLTNGQRPNELKMLQDYLAADVAMTTSGWMYTNEIIPQEITVAPDDPNAEPTEEDIDFLIILGEASANLVMR
ncbi:MAG: LCP family protein [Candidatus Uhrbacteria bacterium]|nr:LCP family protein [Patescibacteria group bacterium]MBU1907371.1 LCP family protein [Patescibacteria group bacterium]